jgi:hypothetical protein
MDVQTKEQVPWPRDAWRLCLRLSVPSLEPPTIQYGVFSEDPRTGFSSDLKRVEQVFQQKLAEIEDPGKRQALRRLQLAGVWGHLFRALRGDEVYLLISPGSGTTLMSNAPAGAKWLVTKPVEICGRFCGWSVPFEAAAGQEIEISLAQDNILDLEALDSGAQP